MLASVPVPSLFLPVAPVAQVFPGFQHGQAKRTPNETRGLTRSELKQSGQRVFAPWVHRTVYCEITDAKAAKRSVGLVRRRMALIADDDTNTRRRPAYIWQVTPVGLWIQWWVPVDKATAEDLAVREAFLPNGLGLGAKETILWADWFTEQWRFWVPPTAAWRQ